MKKKIFISTVVIVSLLALILAVLRANRNDDEIKFTAIVTQVDFEHNIAYARSALRNPVGSLWDKLLEKKLPDNIMFDISNLDVELNMWDVITGYYICGSIDGQTIHVTRIISQIPDAKYYADARSMVKAIAADNLDEAWSYVYDEMADSGLKEKLTQYKELLNSHEVKRFDAYECEKTGEYYSEDSTYTEITYYKIYSLTEDFSGEPDFYAKVTAMKDSGGEGIISLDIKSDYFE